MKKIGKKSIFILPIIVFSAVFFISKVYSQDNTSLPVSGTVPVTDVTSSADPTIGTNSDEATSSASTTASDSPTETTTETDNTQDATDQKRATTTADNKPQIRINASQDLLVYLIKVRGADRIECYAEREGVGNPFFLGAAKKIQEDEWELKIDIKAKIPNGTYTGFAKIIDGDGGYRTDKAGFSINRPVAANVSADSALAIQNQIGQNDEIKNQQPETAGSGGNQSAPFQNQVNNLENDFDRDGIPNDEEKRLGTNPLQADSDQDGYLDGDELRNGFNPLKFSPGDKSDKIVFQSPKEKGQVDQSYAVENVEMKKDPEKGNIYRLSGKALPNIYLTVYIYSQDPIVITVKTDENGNWTYELEKDLDNGDHEVYVAITDNAGKITSKSNPLKFVKTAEAVSVVQATQDYDVSQPPGERQKSNALLYATIVVTLFLAAALALIGFVTTHHKEKNEGIN